MLSTGRYQMVRQFGVIFFFACGQLVATAQCPPVLSSLAPGSSGDSGITRGAAPAMSADGRFIAFVSYASNVVPGDNNNLCDAFLLDRQSGATIRVSATADGLQTGCNEYVISISDDGRYVGLASYLAIPGDTNGTTDALLFDRITGVLERVSVGSDG